MTKINQIFYKDEHRKLGKGQGRRVNKEQTLASASSRKKISGDRTVLVQ